MCRREWASHHGRGQRDRAADRREQDCPGCGVPPSVKDKGPAQGGLPDVWTGESRSGDGGGEKRGSPREIAGRGQGGQGTSRVCSERKSTGPSEGLCEDRGGTHEVITGWWRAFYQNR